MLRAVRAAFLLISAALLVVTAAAPVAAQDVPRLEGPVTDRTGVLDGSQAEIATAIERVRNADGVDVWVLFVDTNDGQTAEEFARRTFETNSLGGNDALFVVALTERTDFVWTEDPDITSDEIERASCRERVCSVV